MPRPKRQSPHLTVPEWERQPDEGNAAFLAFTSYRDLGPTRSVKRAAGQMGKTVVNLSKLSAKYAWVERATAFDDHHDRARQRGAERAAEDDGELWMRRRREAMDRDHADSQELRGAALALIRSITGDRATTDRLDAPGADLDLTVRQKKDMVATLASATAMLKTATEIGWGAINAGVGDLAAPAIPGPQGTPDK